jgi:hypothetical protein
MSKDNTDRSPRQSARILELLRAAHGSLVPLPKILAQCIAQYRSRILELRRLGFQIENRMERVRGARRSWYRLLDSPSSRVAETLELTGGAAEKRDHARLTTLPLFDRTVEP